MFTVVCIIPSATNNRSYHCLCRCINSIKQALVEDIDVVIIVATTNQHPKLTNLNSMIEKVIIAPKSSGFSDLNNAALHFSINKISSQYYLFLNDDAWLDVNFFQNLKSVIVKHKSSIIVPMVLNKAGEVYSYGMEYFTSGFVKNSNDTVISTSLAPASCMLVKTTLLKRIKAKYGFVFNPKLYYYYDDVEFSIRAIAVGGSIRKTKQLLAHHVGSFTSKDKSYFTYYHSFRNLIWVIIMTWPAKIIYNHFLRIIIVYTWLTLTVHFKGKHFMPIKILVDTTKNLKQLLMLRKKILTTYPTKFNFEALFSRYMFRTRRTGKPI